MSNTQLEIGQEFHGVLGELVKDHDGNRKRVVTKGNINIPNGMYIECSKSVREANKLGTIFKVNAGVSRKQTGALYLRALKKYELLTVDEWNIKYGH